ncbi:MAG: hypothetical protein IJ050_03835 [Clostridia bacterium]|nr:hypothetical protein [Clostridia bacterium]
MFKLITALIALITAMNSYAVTPAKDAPSKEEQHALYIEFLKNDFLTYSWTDDYGVFGAFDSQQDLSKRYYAFYDIDGNGIDEMLVGESGVEKDRKASACYIFFIENNEVKPVKYFMGYFDWFDRYGPVFYSDGKVYDYAYGPEVIPAESCGFYRLEDGKMKCWCRFDAESDFKLREAFKTCKVTIYGDEEETKYEIPSFIAKIIIDYLKLGKTVEPDWQPVAQFAQP